MKFYLTIFATLAVLIGGIYIGYRVFRPSTPSPTIDSQTIVTMLKQEGFLVTQTYVFNQQVKIKTNSGSVFKDFFWGQDISASGNMKVSSGVDLNKINFKDIQVTSHDVTLQLPNIETHSIELIGDLTLQNNQGILKRVFNNDDGYNQAYKALEEKANEAAATTTLRLEAQKSTEKEINQLVQLIAKDRQVRITFKP